MIASFAAGCGNGLYSFDFERAFINAEAGQDDLLIQLPIMPKELLGKGLGVDKGSFSPEGVRLVGRLKRLCADSTIHPGCGSNIFSDA